MAGKESIRNTVGRLWRPSAPLKVHLDWSMPEFRDASIEGIAFAGDLEVESDRARDWTKVGIIGTPRAPFAERLALGGIAAAAHTDPGSNWHVGMASAGEAFSAYGEGDELTATVFRIGHGAVRLAFGIVEDDIFSGIETMRVAETTLRGMMRDPLLKQVTEVA